MLLIIVKLDLISQSRKDTVQLDLNKSKPWQQSKFSVTEHHLVPNPSDFFPPFVIVFHGVPHYLCSTAAWYTL